MLSCDKCLKPTARRFSVSVSRMHVEPGNYVHDGMGLPEFCMPMDLCSACCEELVAFLRDFRPDMPNDQEQRSDVQHVRRSERQIQ